MYPGDNSHMNIVGHSRVKTRFLDGRVNGIDGVLHILGLARNLLSVSKLGNVGVWVVFLINGCNMTRGSMMLIEGVRICTFYKLDTCMIK